MRAASDYGEVLERHGLTPEVIVKGARRERGGFLAESDVKVFASFEHARLWPVLVRCGRGRFTAPADQVLHFVKIVQASEVDHVRDLSLVAGYDYR